MKKILIIEDDENFGSDLADFLERRGFSVLRATKIKDAIEMFLENKVDIELIALDGCVDSQEHELDTVPLIKLFRKEEYTSHIVAISNNALHRTEMCFEGCSHQCPKYAVHLLIIGLLK